MNINQFQDNSRVGLLDWPLRGIGQVVFQNSPLPGAVILFALFFKSWIYGSADFRVGSGPSSPRDYGSRSRLSSAQSGRRF